MKLIEQTHICNSLDKVPNFNDIRSLSRGIRWKVIFTGKIKSKREKIGEKWKFEHPNFQIGIHTTESEINIIKLITDKEIEKHQDYFEKCAKDYRNLATKLINEFADKYNIKIDPEYPMNTLSHTNRLGYKPVGKMNDWRYAFHGIHCAFTNEKTNQYIEVPLMYGLEFGELDPYFFSKYINSTTEYNPRPTEIYDEYWDGNRVLKKMVELGKFEKIQSNWQNQTGIVVTDRDKIEVKVYNPEVTQNDKRKHFQLIHTIWSKLKNL